MILGPRGPFVARKGKDSDYVNGHGWWEVIDTSRKDQDRLALAYRGKGAKASAKEAAKFMNDYTEEYRNDTH